MNYSEIKTVALGYADRSDTKVTARMDDFLRVVEARVNRKLKIMEMEDRTQITMDGSEYYSLPSDFGGLRDVEYRASLSSTDRSTLIYTPPEVMNAIADEDRTSYYYTIIDNTIHVIPAQTSGIVEIVYYKNVPVLSDSNTTNWLGDNYPDCYIFGLMVEISSFVKNAEAAQLWEQRFLDSVASIETGDLKNRWGGPSLQIWSV